jgi:hypothetical protein
MMQRGSASSTREREYGISGFILVWARDSDHLGPLHRLAGDEIAEFVCQAFKHGAAKFKRRIDVFVQLIDHIPRVPLGASNPNQPLVS